MKLYIEWYKLSVLGIPSDLNVRSFARFLWFGGNDLLFWGIFISDPLFYPDNSFSSYTIFTNNTPWALTGLKLSLNQLFGTHLIQCSNLLLHVYSISFSFLKSIIALPISMAWNILSEWIFFQFLRLFYSSHFCHFLGFTLFLIWCLSIHLFVIIWMPLVLICLLWAFWTLLSSLLSSSWLCRFLIC